MSGQPTPQPPEGPRIVIPAELMPIPEDTVALIERLVRENVALRREIEDLRAELKEDRDG